jgi:SAM-dependent methyltransferase
VPGLQPSGLPITGERTVPHVPGENYWFRRHEACYRWALDAIADPVALPHRGTLLDAGAGEGFGADAAAARGYRVTALELDTLTAGHIRRSYPKLGVVRANLVALPFAAGSFDACLSLQVIEHIWDVPTYLMELLRCTSGPIILSTPNRPVHSPGLAAGETPVNVFHVREYDVAEIDALIHPHLNRAGRICEHFGLRHGLPIAEWEEENGSLPQALMSGEDPAFAASVRESDFVIEPFSDEHADSYLDLVSVL